MRAIASRFFTAALCLSCFGLASFGDARFSKADDTAPAETTPPDNNPADNKPADNEPEDTSPPDTSLVGDEDRDGGTVDLTYHRLENQVAHTSIIWVDKSDRGLQAGESVDQIARDFVAAANDTRRLMKDDASFIQAPAEVYEGLAAFVVDMAPEEAERLVKKWQKPDAARDLKRDVAFASSLSVSADMIVSIMDDVDCSDDAKDFASAGITKPVTPIGVSRVKGGGTAGTYPKKVWIIDSGLDNASKLINADMNSAANCSQKSGPCVKTTPATFDKMMVDKLGHGTMLAGIAAATPRNTTDPSLIGVAPGAIVVPVKIFKNQPSINLSGPPLKALEYVSTNAAPGDIVNISWGAAWLEGMNRKKNQIETVWNPTSKGGLIATIYNMATVKNLKLVLAAGNVDSVTRPSWVQFVMPAGAGSFPAPNTGCAVCTVSAVESTLNTTTGKWADKFWYDLPATPAGSPRFGSDYGRNPPDFAEPGVKVTSLWPSGKTSANLVNTCSGTSFAAAHLSGILVRGMPKAEFTVTGDPDSPDKAMADPVGVLP